MNEVTFHKFGHTIEVKEDGKVVGGYTKGGMHKAGRVFLWRPFDGWTKEKVKQVAEDHLGKKQHEWKL